MISFTYLLCIEIYVVIIVFSFFRCNKSCGVNTVLYFVFHHFNLLPSWRIEPAQHNLRFDSRHSNYKATNLYNDKLCITKAADN